jgi:predicted nucleotidyltransferase
VDQRRGLQGLAGQLQGQLLRRQPAQLLVHWRQALAGRYNDRMKRKHPNLSPAQPFRWYRGADIPMRVIRRFARQVAERFQPDKIILFGSYAYGTPHADSDVDILVIMPARNEFDQAFKIRCEVPTQFPMDLIVLKPRNVKWRLEERESFLTEIMTKGIILHEKNDSRMDTQSGGRLSRGRNPRRGRRTIS